MSLIALPVEIMEEIAAYLHQMDLSAYHNLRLCCKRMMRIPDIRSQKEFDQILKMRYRKDALRIFLKYDWIEPSQSFAEKAAEYGQIGIKILILDVLKKLNNSSIDFQQLFRHSVRMNLANAVAHLVSLDTVDPFQNDQEALIVAAMQGHQEVLIELLKLNGADPNKCVDYAGTDAIERMLRRDPRCNKKREIIPKKKTKKVKTKH